MARHLSADRTALWLFDVLTGSVKYGEAYLRDGNTFVTPTVGRDPAFFIEVVSKARSGVVTIHDCSQIPHEDGNLQKFFSAYGIRAIMAVPIIIDGEQAQLPRQ